ncbi:2-amino-4-hydroxy-6-hydroxymethyldihydropteridine diphosphokinase [Leptothoe spongobia]|uniref:2-amino-4-hydroxy-6-hydroxymethyldihydropteridine diphosphokinase n=1 Tax=Leptothoe spongobia TAU-MAC 1115 TaxID=1967444 RepID=A0A947DAP3_9CYAN|nr:2-amino-4-hydroxy-6-hydroxymethyldihydropteridine diphosphokinase [Leptothoe spongobia]MBT9313955.1 2-amino-4-hydroxy-6-hydroxymethyldihydropteridine diphosphokinase [Leptothoe spongobia TAU-MAC 1115]
METACAIALGSNLGDSEQTIETTLARLDQIDGMRVGARSRLYKTAPVGPPQPDYINACAIVQTTLSPAQMLQVLLAIEASFGRIRRERWGPRTLDLDLLLYGDRVIDTPTLTLPHPRMHERAFVLVPLAEIAPDWQHPVSQRTVAELLRQVDPSGVYPLVA